MNKDFIVIFLKQKIFPIIVQIQLILPAFLEEEMLPIFSSALSHSSPLPKMIIDI